MYVRPLTRYLHVVRADRLEGCDLENDGMVMLCVGLAATSTLRVLNLADNDISLRGMAAFATVLEVRACSQATMSRLKFASPFQWD